MELLFVPVGGAFAVLFLLFALIATVRRRAEITFVDILLVFISSLTLLTGLVLAALDGVTSTRVALGVVVIAAILILAGIVLSIAEWFRPQRLKQSRGVLSVGTGILLILVSVFVPFAGAYFSLPPRGVETASLASVSGQPTPDDSAKFMNIFQQVIQIIAESTGLSFDQVLTALDNGQTVAQLVSDHHGDLDQVVTDITKLMQDFVRALAAENRIDPLRATAGIAGMEVVVRYAVNNDLGSLQRAGNEGNAATDEATPGEGTARSSFFEFLTATVPPAGTPALSGASGTPVMLTSTPLPTVTAPPTSEPSATRTPRPTATATRTRAHYMTPTPTLTETLPRPCVAVANYNINMRARPALDADLVTTIPYQTVVNVFGRNEESTWWFAEYEGQAGWISGEFITLTSSCEKLPVRPVPRS